LGGVGRDLLRKAVITLAALIVGGTALVAVLLFGLRAYFDPAPELPCDLDLTAEIASRDLGSRVRLRDVTSFSWRSVHLFGEYASAELVREQTGHPYERVDPFNHVPECSMLFVFRLENGATCEASVNRARGRHLECPSPFDSEDPICIVRREGHDPRFTNCGPAGS
jgi:hypothetical protein